MSELNSCKSVEDKIKVFERDLTVIAIFGLQDPLRDEIVNAVTTCDKAGVTVRMCTGDNQDTANAISVEAGIVTKEELNGVHNKYASMIG